ncbi:hypothetical protein Pst134EB_023420 [Puccinia striiformis f. sp. tritici]|nr:hypothetical protein Pst134EB_023420 [Puccinia striiformis f. sp. tritici]
MDHAFWTDGLYYHSDAPWSTDPNVREGINCILILGRIQEEFELLAQELARAMGWAVATHTRFTDTVDCITKRIELINVDPSTLPNRLDELVLGDLRRVEKLNLIKQELIRSTSEHANLVLDWNDNITWLWKRCQPTGNDIHFQQWLDLVEKANQSQVDDGDDAEAYLIYQFEGLSNNDHAESRPAPAVDDQVLAINNQLANSPVTVA